MKINELERDQGHLISIFDDSQPADHDTKLYFELIDRLAKKPKDLLVSNGLPEHAAYLIFTLLENAKKNIALYTSTLAKAIGGVRIFSDTNIINAAVNFLETPNTTLQILVSDQLELAEGLEPKDHPFVNAIVSDKNVHGSFGISRISDDSMKFQYPFLVVDESAFRVELEPSEARAVANFNEPKFATRLNKLFQHLAQSATPLLPGMPGALD